jgi:hypothetical protein
MDGGGRQLNHEALGSTFGRNMETAGSTGAKSLAEIGSGMENCGSCRIGLRTLCVRRASLTQSHPRGRPGHSDPISSAYLFRIGRVHYSDAIGLAD